MRYIELIESKHTATDPKNYYPFDLAPKYLRKFAAQAGWPADDKHADVSHGIKVWFSESQASIIVNELNLSGMFEPEETVELISAYLTKLHPGIEINVKQGEFDDDNNDNVDFEIDDSDIEEIILKVWKKKYPKVPLHFKHDDYTYATTGEQYQTMMIDRGDVEIGDEEEDTADFNLALTANSYDGDADVVIGDAQSGQYSGVIGNILKALFKELKKRAPDAKQELVIKSDSSGGAWQHIANKLGVDYINDY